MPRLVMHYTAVPNAQIAYNQPIFDDFIAGETIGGNSGTDQKHEKQVKISQVLASL